MKIFLSWSGDQSKQLAEVLRGWLPKVIQASKPWMSEEDIASGARWSTEISGQLNESSFGIICVNQDNQANAWLQFEAGALSKTVKLAFVVPYLHLIEPTEIIGPLSQFQANRSDKEGTLKMLYSINSALPTERIEKEELDEIFEVWWPKLEEKIACIRSESPLKEAKRSPDDMLEEMLGLTRELIRKEDTRIARSKEMDQKTDELIGFMETFTNEVAKMTDVKQRLTALTGIEGGKLQIPEINPDQILGALKDMQVMSKEFTKELEAPIDPQLETKQV